MSTTSIIHRPTPYAAGAAVAGAVAAVAVVLSLSGSWSLPGSGSDQPTLIEAPGYAAYPPGGLHAGTHHSTTAGGQVMLGQ